MEEAMASGWPGVEDYIRFAESLRLKCFKLNSVQGTDKLARKIAAEIKFLNSLKKHCTKVQSCHLQSSNLCHFASIVHAAERVPGVVRVLKPIRHPEKSNNLVVDVVGANGHVWVKVIARKAQALHLVWAGQGQFGERDLLSQAEEYIARAKANPIDFTSPQVHYAFYNQVTEPMAEAIRLLGIKVWGAQVQVSPDVQVKLDSVLYDDEESLDSECGEDDDDDNDDDEEEEPDNNNDDVGDLDIDHGDDTFVRQHNKDIRATDDHIDVSRSHVINSAVESGEYKIYSTSSNSFCDVSQNSESSSIHGNNHSVVVGAFAAMTIDKHGQGENGTSSSPKVVSRLHSSCDQAFRSFAKPSDESRVSMIKIRETDQSLHDTTQCKQTAETAKQFSANPESLSSSPEIMSSNSPCPPTVQTQLNPRSASNPSPIASPSFEALFHRIVISAPEFHDSMGLVRVSTNPTGACTTTRMPFIIRANLDITTLITLVSSVTHGNCHFVFVDKVLNIQAQEEQRSPVLPLLNAFLEGKELFACQTAVTSFQSILDIMGGAREKERAADLLARVNIVEDDSSPRAQALVCHGKIKDRSKIVFGTGDKLQAVTVTSNSGFVRAAAHQGVVFSTYLHSARALTEQKECEDLKQTACPNNVSKETD